jgi:hypothetical protein
LRFIVLVFQSAFNCRDSSQRNRAGQSQLVLRRSIARAATYLRFAAISAIDSPHPLGDCPGIQSALKFAQGKRFDARQKAVKSGGYQ